MEDCEVSFDHARHQCVLTRDWLVTLQENAEHYQSFTLKHILQILLGLWICERAFADDSEYVYTQAQIQHVSQHMATHRDITADLLQADSSLVLLTTGILHVFDVRISLFERFAQQIGQVLRAHPDQNEEEANELYLVRFLLQRLHEHPVLQPCPLREFPALQFILADDAAVRTFASIIAAVTDHGQRIEAVPPFPKQQLQTLLPILVIDYLRTYNLEPGMQLLRCMRYLNLCQGRSFHACYHFLCEQQQSDGRFGFFEQEIARLRLYKERPERDEANLNVYLPYSISFLWTLAEVVHPQFVLVKSIG